MKRIKTMKVDAAVASATRSEEHGAIEERRLVVRYLHDIAAHWRNEARRYGSAPPADAAVAKCAVLEGVAADIHDGVHTRRPT